ncbi:MAG: SdrD B-like domain-containing protein [Pirellulaceae bacterium]
MVWQRLTRRWKKDAQQRPDSKTKRRRRLSMEALAKRELLASDFGSITGTAYNDANNNNVFDAGEVGLANVNISIAGPVNATVQTNAQGVYRFDDLVAGTYTVTQDPPAPAGFNPEPTASPQTIVFSAAEVDGEGILAIDGFDGTNQAVEASANVGGVNPNQSSAVDATVIGGTRDIFVNVTSVAGIARASSNDPTPGILEIDPSGNGAAVYTVTYDGDNDANNLDATGLNVDLTQAGTGTAAQALLGFDVAPGSAGIETFEMIFYTDAANFTTYSFNLPATAAAAPTAEVIMRFDGTGELNNGGATEAAVVTNTGTGADFTNIGAIQLVVDTDNETAVDGNIDTLRVIGPTVKTANFANDQIVPLINIEKSTNGFDADTTTGPLLGVGSTATFTYNVTNPGNVALANVVVGDDNGTPGNAADDLVPTFVDGDTNNNNRLDAGETWQYTATRVVTEGQYTNISDVVGEPVDANGVAIPGLANPTDTDPSNHLGVRAEVLIEKATNGEDADTTTGPQLGVGTTATFTYVVTNPGTVALANVNVTDDQGVTPVFQSGDTNNNNRLDVTETWTYTATAVVTAGQYTNIGTVTGNPVDANGTDIPDLADPTDTDPSNHFGVSTGIQIEKATNGFDADTATGPELAVGSTATFTYVVTNTGTTALATVVVTDDQGVTPVFQSGDTNNNNRLDVTETWTYTATAVVTAGQYTNIGTATGNPVDANGVDIAGLNDPTDTDPSNHIGVTAGVQIEKATNGVDADTATGPQLAVGSTATFTYVVTNTGTTSLATVVVTDDQGVTPTLTSGDTNANGILEVTETWTFTATAVVTAGQYTNIGTVTGNPVDSNGTDIAGLANPTDTDPSNHIGVVPGIQVEKATNGFDADTAIGPQLGVGSTATFTYVVTNTGSTALGSINLVDDRGVAVTLTGGDVNNNNILETTETWTFTGTTVVTAGQYTNIATVTGNPVDNNGADIPGVANVTDTDPSNHFGVTAGVQIEKATNGIDADTATGPQLAVGSIATFTYVVTNTGTTPLGTVNVTDNRGVTPVLQSGDTNANGLLDTTETWTYQATTTVVAGQYTNIGTVTGNPVDGTGADIASLADVNDTDPSNHIGVSAGINIEKATNGVDADTATGPSLAVGSTATFTYVVTNTGTTQLASVSVTDNRGVTPILQSGDTDGDGRLDVTETWTYTANAVVTAGQYTNIGTATGNPVDANGNDIAGLADVSDTDPSNHIGVTPSLTIEKSTNGIDADTATGPRLDVGSTATFSYQVTNTGGVALNNLVVTDDGGTTGTTTDDFNPTFNGGDTNANGVFDIGEVWLYSATRIVTLGQYTNIATATANNPAGGTINDTDPSNHIGVAPGTTLSKRDFLASTT